MARKDVVGLADRDLGRFRQPIDGPLILRAGEEDLDGADAGRAETRLVPSGARTRRKPATFVIDVHERPGPAQVQRPAPIAPGQSGSFDSVSLLVEDRPCSDEADRPAGHRVSEVLGDDARIGARRRPRQYDERTVLAVHHHPGVGVREHVDLGDGGEDAPVSIELSRLE
jgi:hypothetical protein